MSAHGGSSFAETNSLQRIWRDSAVAARDAVTMPIASYEIYGKALLGRDDRYPVHLTSASDGHGMSKETGMSTSNTDSCLICAMETTESGSVIFRDNLWAAEIGPGMEVPGWFVLRTRRHAELITGLDDAEADGLGRRLRTLVAAVAE